MTEGEAEKKFCPFDRWSMTQADGSEDAPKCIGSACMAWRWRWTPEKIAGAAEGSLLATRKPDGFCGVVGGMGA